MKYAYGLILIGIVAAAWLTRHAEDPLRSTLRKYRPFELYLAEQSERPCSIESTTGAFHPVRCSDAPLTLPSIDDISTSADSGRLELITAGSDSVALDRAVVLLDRAVSADSAVDDLNDLSVAYAVRGVELSRPHDLFHALELTYAVLERSPSFEAAQKNRDLLLNRLSLTIPAAQSQLHDLTLREDSTLGALEEWAGAALRNDRAGIHAARATLARYASKIRMGDSTVAHIAAAVDSREDSRIAEGVSAYVAGFRLMRSGSYEAADSAFVAAASTLPRDHVINYWAQVGLIGTAFNRGDHSAVDRITHAVLTTVSPRAFPSVHARTHWIQGVSRGRRGRHDAALQSYIAAAGYYSGLDEPTNAAAVQYLTAEMLALLGRTDDAEERIISALEQFHAAGISNNYHDFLLYLGRYMLRAGFIRVARAVHGVGRTVADRTGRTKDPAEVAIRLAQTEIAAGDSAAAERHLATAEQLYARVQGAGMADRGRVDLVDTRAELAMTSDPHLAAQHFGGVVEYFRRQNNQYGVLRALIRRSDAWQSAAAPQMASADLREAARLVENGLSEMKSSSDSVAFRETGASVYERLVAAQLAAGHADSAFSTVSRARGLARVSAGSSTAPDVLRRTLATKQAIIRYAVLPDRLVTWVLDADTMRVHVVNINRTALTALVDSFAVAARGNTPNTTMLAERLHELLLNGTERYARVHIDPDAVLAGVPWASLRSPATGRFFVQDAVIVMGGGAHERQRTPTAPNVVVALASQPDRSIFPELTGLPGAEAEAAAVVATHDDVQLIDSEAATAKAITIALQRADVFHFAGHSWAHPTDAGRSFLVTAADASGSPTLPAADIARLRLPRNPLVILSSCSSARRGKASADMRGLAHAFLTAGARAVIGSVWDVSDRSTAALFEQFHRHLSAGMPPAEALRSAQLYMITSTNPQYRNPSAWAGFQLFTN